MTVKIPLHTHGDAYNKITIVTPINFNSNKNKNKKT